MAAGCRVSGGGEPSGGPSAAETGQGILFGRVLANEALVNASVLAVDEGLVPVPGAEVWIEGLPFFPHAVTNASGEYIFEHIPLGSHRLVASFTSRLTGKSLKCRSGALAVAAGQPAEFPAMSLLAATKIVSGVLRDASGTPFPAGVKLVVWGEIVTTLASGVFSSPPLPTAETLTDLSVLSTSASTSPTSRPASSTVTVPLVPRGTAQQIDVTIPVTPGEIVLNHPPVVRLTVPKTTLLPGERITCTAAATDPDPEDQAKPMSVSWAASGGTIVKTATDAFAADFTAPLSTGTATIAVSVADARGATSTTSLRLAVSETQEGNASDTEDDLTPPTAVLTSTAGSVANAAFPVTIAFSEDVVGFDLSKLTIGNGTAINLQQITANRVYSCTVVPLVSGLVTVDLAAGKVVDAAGNPNLAAVRLTKSYGTDAPTVVLSSTAPQTTNDVIPLTVTFSEEVTGFYLSKLTVKNGVASDRRMTVSNRVFTCIITPATTGTVTVDLAADKVFDASGTGNIAAAQFVRMYDARPAVTLSTTASATTNAPIPLVVTFSEKVYGFDLTKLTIANGTAEYLRTLEENRVFSCIVMPVTNGSVTIDLAAGKVVDSAGNANTAAKQLFRMFDDIRPTVALTSLSPYATNATFSVTITFSEDVTGFNLTKLTLENAVAGDFQTTTPNRVYSCTIYPLVSGDVTVNLFENSVIDAGGNGNITATQLTRFFDNIPPDNQDTVLSRNLIVRGSEPVAILSSGDAYNTVWLAPHGTTTFSESQSMTSVYGEATSIPAPALEGTYRLFIRDFAGNVSSASTAVVQVDNTAPTNQNAVLAANAWVRPGLPVAIESSGDTGNTIWLAPYGTMLFYPAANMTNASGTAVSITAPLTEGNYRIYVIDGVGNVSQPSAAQVVVDAIPPSFSPTYPQAANVTMAAADMLVKLTEDGYVYFKHYTSAQPVMTAAGLKAAGETFPQSGGVEGAINLLNLAPGTIYYAYFAIEDNAGNLNPNVVALTFETSTFGYGN
ncbi:MAG TPA: Ig-like domain-containing protein [Candidatus Ozemobacteraceae bacterium]|nr:Ig-like domain-containing protein [Candidatus Ozemobacteraceae bacterium]